jgi:hypothetical protein
MDLALEDDPFAPAKRHCPHRVHARSPFDVAFEGSPFDQARARRHRIVEWCVVNFGPFWDHYGTEEPETARWFCLGSAYYFHDANEAFWFKMTWG